MILNNKYERNIFLIYLFHILFGLSIGWIVIETLYYQSFELSYFQISQIFLISALLILILEIPTGAYADLYGRRKSLILTGILLLIGAIIYTFSNNFYHFLFGVIFYSSAQAFGSGSMNALVFESLKKLKREKEFEFIISRQHFFFIFTAILTNFFAPVFFELERRLPLKISLFFSLLTIICTFFLYEKIEIRKKKKESLFQKYYNQILNSITQIKNNKLIIWYILFFSIWGLGLGIFGYLINQPFVKQNYSFIEYGIIFSLASAVQALILFYSKEVLNKIQNSKFSFLILIWTLSLGLLLITNNLILLILILGLMWSLGSFTYIIIESNINKHIKEDSERATILSINSMFYSLITVLLVPIFGLFLDIITLEQMILVLSIYSLVIGLLLLFIKKYFK